MRRILPLPMAAALSVVCMAPLTGQQPLPPPRARDPTPFVRLAPLTAILSTSNATTIARLQTILFARGYKTTAVNADRGEIAAVKADANDSESSDRVILWLERDPLSPSTRAYLYLQYARFESFFGNPEPQRARVESSEELARTAELRDTLIAFALSQALPPPGHQ